MAHHSTQRDTVAGEELDPRRWLTLAIVVLAVVVAAIDSTVLNVVIPTMLRELHTTVPTIEWVLTGYALTFSAFLMVGGRLGDLYGHRRLFVAGVALFGLGSLVASTARSVGMLILGEAVIEGLGAAIMLPSSLAILSDNFRGRERGTAFAVWGTTSGAAIALGPVLGGFLTTHFSWRWAFRINVLVAPVAIVGALLLMPKGIRKAKVPIDVLGAVLIAAGAFFVVFALSQGGLYGWLAPTKAFAVGSTTLWPTSAPVSIVPVTLLTACGLLVAFVVHEGRRERIGGHPLFELSQLRYPSFRYGLATIALIALGQMGFLLALSLFLQDAAHLSAMQNGLWLLPLGLSVVAAAHVGGRITRRTGPTLVVRVGAAAQVVAFAAMAQAVHPHMSFWQLVPSLALFGAGMGFTNSQLTNVMLSEIPSHASGVASGANSTAKQFGGALGVAIIGSIMTVLTVRHAVHGLDATAMSEQGRQALEPIVRELGPNTQLPTSLSAADATAARRLLADAITSAARWAFLFQAGALGLAAVLSTRLPKVALTTYHEVVEPAVVGPAVVAPEAVG